VTAEAVYLCSLLRSVVTGGPAPTPGPSLSWQRLALLFREHPEVIPTVAFLLPETAPRDLVRQIQRYAQLLRWQAMLLSAELSRTLEVLESAGLEPILLKGPALARTVYPDPDLRYSHDLDILIESAGLDEACDLLQRSGFRPKDTVAVPLFYERHHFHRILISPSGLLVELHWDLSKPADFFRFDLREIRRRSRVVAFRGSSIRVLDPADQLLHLAAQEIDAGFCDLRHVVDAALLIEAEAAKSDLPERAQRQGLSTALWELLAIVREVTGTVVPAEVERSLRPGTFKAVCLSSLNLTEKAIELYVRRHSGIRSLVRWLCTPGIRALGREVARFLLPGDSYYLQLGYEPTKVPGRARRILETTKRSWSLLKILSYQTARLLPSGWR
jgi:hypothetical protein